jgi:hypothetical protein
VVVTPSAHTYDETCRRLIEAIERRSLTVFARIGWMPSGLHARERQSATRLLGRCTRIVIVTGEHRRDRSLTPPGV